MRLPRVAIAILWAMVVALGPATGMQVLAWANMLMRDITTRPLIESVQRTFDGRHPCCMCLVAAELREAETGDRRTPAAEGRVFVHLACADVLRWRPPVQRSGAGLPGWPSPMAPVGIDPDPDDPVPRRRS